MWQTIQRFQLALRLHFAARKHLGLRVDVALLMSHPAYAHDVLTLCHDSGHPVLALLARHFARRNGRASARACLALAACKARAELALVPPSAACRPSSATLKMPSRPGSRLPTRVPTRAAARMHGPRPLWVHSAHGA